MTAAACLLAFLLLWSVAPLIVLAFLPVGGAFKVRAARCLLGAAVRALLVLPASLAAPVIVPVALAFTPREANALPSWARWWDNDAGINGDQPEGAPTYYALGHDRRSFYARFVWLGLRNRATWLAMRLGHAWGAEYADLQTWGDPLTDRDHEGWFLRRRGDVFRLYVIRRLGSRLVFRMNWGYKVPAAGDPGPPAAVVAISASILSWEGG